MVLMHVHTARAEDDSPNLATFGAIIGVFVAVAVAMCIVNYLVRGGLRRWFEIVVLRRKPPEVIDEFRGSHGNRVANVGAAEMRKDMAVDVFSGGTHKASRVDRAAVKSMVVDLSGVDSDASSGEEDGEPANEVHEVAMHYPKGNHPVLVQANRPLAQASPEVGKNVYFEVEIDDIHAKSTLAIGWASHPQPPFVMLGDTSHAVALVSHGKGLVLDTRKIGSGPSIGVHGKCLFRTSQDRSSGLATATAFLKKGDVIGCGYTQHKVDGAHEKHPRLQIQFWFAVNGERVELPDAETTFYAINSVWDREKALTAFHNPDANDVGILSNGCAHPSVSSTGPCRVFMRFVKPFTHLLDAEASLSEYQGKSVAKRLVLRNAPTAYTRRKSKNKNPIHAKPWERSGSKTNAARKGDEGYTPDKTIERGAALSKVQRERMERHDAERLKDLEEQAKDEAFNPRGLPLHLLMKDTLTVGSGKVMVSAPVAAGAGMGSSPLTDPGARRRGSGGELGASPPLGLRMSRKRSLAELNERVQRIRKQNREMRRKSEADLLKEKAEEAKFDARWWVPSAPDDIRRDMARRYRDGASFKDATLLSGT